MGAAAEYSDYIKEKQKSRTEKVLQFIYNHEEGTVLGRTALSWCQILVFYIFFYSFLAACFAICLTVFIENLSEYAPKYYGTGSLLAHPGMGVQPWVNTETDPSIISFNTSDPNSYYKYTRQIENFLDRYSNASSTRNCNENQTNADNGQFPCRFDPQLLLEDDLGCSPQTSYGFATGHPCIIVTLNKIIGWTPVPYTNTSIPTEVRNSYLNGSIPLHCVGKYPSDQTHIGEVEFIPETGFDTRYFPYLNRPSYNYQQPFVFVRFLNITAGVTVAIECYAYAANIVQVVEDGLGVAFFQIHLVGPERPVVRSVTVPPMVNETLNSTNSANSTDFANSTSSENAANFSTNSANSPTSTTTTISTSTESNAAATLAATIATTSSSASATDFGTTSGSTSETGTTSRTRTGTGTTSGTTSVTGTTSGTTSASVSTSVSASVTTATSPGTTTTTDAKTANIVSVLTNAALASFNATSA